MIEFVSSGGRVAQPSMVRHGVVVTLVHPMWWALHVIESEWESRYNLPVLRVTRGVDGEHRHKSAHYSGRAVDLRVWGLKSQGLDLKSVAQGLQKELGPDFDVVPHETHLHVEFDPKVQIKEPRPVAHHPMET